ncbi:hypothetical protein R6Q57_009659 [Mikania cordata]
MLTDDGVDFRRRCGSDNHSLCVLLLFLRSMDCVVQKLINGEAGDARWRRRHRSEGVGGLLVDGEAFYLGEGCGKKVKDYALNDDFMPALRLFLNCSSIVFLGSQVDDLSADFIISQVILTIMADQEPKPLEYVSEIVLKKRKNNENWAIRRKEQLEQRVKKSKGDNFVIKKPEQFVREYHDRIPVITLKSFDHKSKIWGFLMKVESYGGRQKLDEFSRVLGKSDDDLLKIVKVGAGAWGSVFAALLQDSYGQFRDKVQIRIWRRGGRTEAIWDADIVVNGLPSTETREVFEKIRNYWKERISPPIIISLSKGIEAALDPVPHIITPTQMISRATSVPVLDSDTQTLYSSPRIRPCSRFFFWHEVLIRFAVKADRSDSLSRKLGIQSRLAAEKKNSRGSGVAGFVFLSSVVRSRKRSGASDLVSRIEVV